MSARSISARVDAPSDESSGDGDGGDFPTVYPTVDGELSVNTGTYQQSAACTR
jgi:hypothetical protein